MDGQCQAVSHQSGERCDRRSTPGAVVCVMHGAAAPAVAAAARRRLVRSAQAEAANALGLGPFPVERTGAAACIERLERRQPRWWVLAGEVLAQAEDEQWTADLAAAALDAWTARGESAVSTPE